MMRRSLSRRAGIVAAAALVALPTLGTAPGLATAQAPSALATSRYPHAVTAGTSMRTIEEVDDGALVGGAQIFVAAGLDRQPKNSGGLAALVAESIVRSPEPGAVAAGTPVSLTAASAPPAGSAAATTNAVTGVAAPAISSSTVSKAPAAPSIRDAIATDGGLLEYTVEGRAVHFYIEAPGDKLPSLIARFGRVLASPSFTPAIVDGARTSLAARAADLEGSALSVGVQMFRRSYYTGGPGQPVLGTGASLASLTSHDAQAFYKANYVRQAVSASLVGAVASGDSPALDALAQALPDGTVSPIVTLTKPIASSAPRIVSRRDVGAPQVVVGFAAPSPASADFGAMLVLESLLSNAFERASATEISDPERSVGAAYLYDTTPASIVVYVNGARVDPSVALRELVLVSRSLAKTKLTPATFARFKTAAEGSFVTDSMTLADRSYLLGTLSSQGLGPDAINAVLISIDKTTPADVQRVAKHYLQRFVIALVLPRSDGSSDGS